MYAIRSYYGTPRARASQTLILPPEPDVAGMTENMASAYTSSSDGTFGITRTPLCSRLATRPASGFVITSYSIHYTKLYEKCARECPCDAISWGDKVMFNGYEMSYNFV